jgi:hypothetical protein
MKSTLLLPLLFLQCGGAADVHASDASAPTSKPSFKAEDLVGTSLLCQKNRTENPNIRLCNLNTPGESNLTHLRSVSLYPAGNKLATETKQDTFKNINAALTSQFAAVAWLSQTNPLQDFSGSKVQAELKKALSTCRGTDQKPMLDLAKELENLNSPRKLGIESLSPQQKKQHRDATIQRSLIAWLESDRIQRFLTDRPFLNKAQKTLLQARQQKIKEAYPIVSTPYPPFALRKWTSEAYGKVSLADATIGHPEIDRILFAEPGKGYAEIKPVRGKKGYEGFVNNILSRPLTPKLELEMRSLMQTSLENSLKSVGAFCGLSPCQSLALSLDETARKLNGLPGDEAKMAYQATCSCNLSTTSVYLSSGKQLALMGVAMGGLVLCPFTFGVGCFVSTAVGAGLSALSVVNTYGALKDSGNINPLARAAKSLPGLPLKDKNRIQEEASDAHTRAASGAVDIVTSVIPGAVGAVGTRGARATQKVERLSAEAGDKYDEIARLQSAVKKSKTAKAGQEAQSKLDEAEKALAKINGQRHSALQMIRDADKSAGAKKLSALEGQLSPLKSKIRDLDGEISRLKILSQQVDSSEAPKIRQQISSLESELAAQKASLEPLQKSWNELADGTSPELRLKQITGRDVQVGKAPSQMETPDPTLYKAADGRIFMMGSGQNYYEYDSMNQFLRGEKVPVKTFDLRYPDGGKMQGPYHTGELPWDLSIVRYEDGSEIMYGGALSPKKFRAGALPNDPSHTTVMAENWTRSGYAFTKKFAVKDPQSGKEIFYDSMEDFVQKNKQRGTDYIRREKVSEVWVRADKDLFGRTIGRTKNWDQHNYGRRIMTNEDGTVWRDENGDPWVMYEKVVGRNKKLGDTKMFAQPMKNPFEVKGKPIEIQGTNHVYQDPQTGKMKEIRFPSTIRSMNKKLTLVEGPNPAQGLVTSKDLPAMTEADIKAFRARFKGTAFEGVDPEKVRWQMVGGSTGDYPTDNYTLIAGVRPVLDGQAKSARIGPLIPLTTGPGPKKDFVDFGLEVKKKYGISWGPARPDLFKDTDGKWWVMFHGVDESVVPTNLTPRVWPSDTDINQFHRNIYVAPVEWKLVDGIPHPKLVDGVRPVPRYPTLTPLQLTPAMQTENKRTPPPPH